MSESPLRQRPTRRDPQPYRIVPPAEDSLPPRWVCLRGTVSDSMVYVVLTCGYPGPKLPPNSVLATRGLSPYVGIQHYRGRPYAVEFRLPVDVKSDIRFWTALAVTCQSWAADFYGDLQAKLIDVYDAACSGVPPQRCFITSELPPYVGFYEAVDTLHVLAGDPTPRPARIANWIAWWSTPDETTGRLRDGAAYHLQWLQRMKTGPS